MMKPLPILLFLLSCSSPVEPEPSPLLHVWFEDVPLAAYYYSPDAYIAVGAKAEIGDAGFVDWCLDVLYESEWLPYKCENSTGHWFYLSRSREWSLRMRATSGEQADTATWSWR